MKRSYIFSLLHNDLYNDLFHEIAPVVASGLEFLLNYKRITLREYMVYLNCFNVNFI